MVTVDAWDDWSGGRRLCLAGGTLDGSFEHIAQLQVGLGAVMDNAIHGLATLKGRDPRDAHQLTRHGDPQGLQSK